MAGLRARLPLAEPVEPIDFGPDGSTLFTTGADVTLREWDLDGSRRFLEKVASPNVRYDERMIAAPGGGRIAYQDSTAITFYDVSAGRLGPTLDRPAGSVKVAGAWDPHGSRYALPTGDHVAVWDARTGEVVSQGRPVDSDVRGVDYSSDGTRLAVADLSGAVVIVDPATLDPLGTRVQLDDTPCAVTLGPDNRTALVATGVPKTTWDFWNVPCSSWALVDLETGSVVDRGTLDLPGVGGIGRVDYSPDGDRVAMIFSDLLVELDLTTGQPLRPPVVAHDGSPTTFTSLTYSPDGRRDLDRWFRRERRLVGRGDGPARRPSRHPIAAFERRVRLRRTLSAARGSERGAHPPMEHQPGVRRRVRLPAGRP